MAKITTSDIFKIFKKNVLARFEVPQSVMKNNGTQFIDGNFQRLMEELRIKQHFSSGEHPQSNGQAEAANWLLVRGLKKRLEEAKGNWEDELPHVLWAYRMTPNLQQGKLTYGVEVIILVEIEELTRRTTNPLLGVMNNVALREEVYLLEDKILKVALSSVIFQQTTSTKYNCHVRHKEFYLGDLVVRRAGIGVRIDQMIY